MRCCDSLANVVWVLARYWILLGGDSEYCPSAIKLSPLASSKAFRAFYNGGHYSLVNNVQGDSIHSDTITLAVHVHQGLITVICSVVTVNFNHFGIYSHTCICMKVLHVPRKLLVVTLDIVEFESASSQVVYRLSLLISLFGHLFLHICHYILVCVILSSEFIG